MVKKKLCSECQKNKPNLKRPKNGKLLCKNCFFDIIEKEIHETIVSTNLFKGLKKVSIGLSGGKDSVALSYIMNLLNKRHNYGLDIQLVCIDEGLIGYRDFSIEAVKFVAKDLELPLKIISFKELFGWTMDEIVKEVGMTNNCTFCGVFRRKALDMGSRKLGCEAILTGHNADDLAETILMNIFRGDTPRLQRCMDIRTSNDSSENLIRLKPFNYIYEKEIVLYAFYKKLRYFSTDCKYYKNSFRNQARDLIGSLYKVRSSSIIDIINSAHKIKFEEKKIKKQVLKKCESCGYVCSQKICRACIYKKSLDSGNGLVGIFESNGKISKGRKKRLVGKKETMKVT